ncbi:two component, sigma54 specific, transcriptional regulator, Fis family [Candidatus Thiomargarita nelsonii]|uniref:Two component, sigma54 specific, transcriptional regulator, Fis family n=1 Tax=Candidatus Thiomargarita nelsonii TaxID=1003181 RepID=A0A0A6NY09_9GAMM|nr:two component, sigma54 specific, transcriptional regulator, Fis family [Candidatus Thiomargarita nelsonii]
MTTTANILIIEDDALLNHMLLDNINKMGYKTEGVTTLKQAREYLSKHEPSLVILDGRLPDGDGMDLLRELNDICCSTILLTAYGSVKNAVEAMKAGAAEYLVKPIDLDELEMMVKRVLENAALRQDYPFYKNELKRNAQGKKLMIGHSPALQEVQKLIDAVAPTDMSVLIEGESGTGKELIANELHQRSERSNRNFVTLDCCTLQEKLFESELFGHERGAFTGADRQKKGLIEGAEGGTLFLDEIGEIEAPIQAKLLRVLETGQFRRLGGTKDLMADVRIIAATNRDLEQMSQTGTFRLDLYYRLSAFVVKSPPLRSRREDIPHLVEHFIKNHNFSRRINKTVTPAAMKALIAYDWPGNIRGLKNMIERAIILSGRRKAIRPEDLSFRSQSNSPQKGVQLSYEDEPSLEDIEKDYMQILLEKYSGHRAKIAGILGISERNTYRLLKKYAL